MSKEKQKDPLFRFLDTLGNGKGDKDATGNYAAVDTSFFIQNNDPHKQYVLHRVMSYIEDSGGSPSLATYGGLTALTDGILCRVVRRDGTILDLTDGMPIQSNSEWARICYDLTVATFPAGNNYAHARWTFSRSGWPIILNTFDLLEFVMRDNLSAYVEHSFLIQGYVN